MMVDNNEQNNLNINIPQDCDAQKNELPKSSSEIENVIDPKDKQIIQLEIELAQFKEQERDNILRLQAELENVRRRGIQEIEKIHKFALERFISELLSVIDNLERTLSIADHSNTVLSSIIEGIELTLKSFLDTMYKFGLESIHAIHIPFNPEIHQAISMVVSDEHESSTVLTIVQKGYTLNGRLIRPAMVIVSKDKC